MTFPKKPISIVALALGLAVATFWVEWGVGAHAMAYVKSRIAHQESGTLPTVSATELPPEARETLKLIRRGGPFPYPKDGVTFHNRERRLPARPRGYYREYTVKTPGIKGRGPQRIVAGGRGELYYTGDHYRTFKRIVE